MPVDICNKVKLFQPVCIWDCIASNSLLASWRVPPDTHIFALTALHTANNNLADKLFVTSEAHGPARVILISRSSPCLERNASVYDTTGAVAGAALPEDALNLSKLVQFPIAAYNAVSSSSVVCWRSQSNSIRFNVAIAGIKVMLPDAAEAYARSFVMFGVLANTWGKAPQSEGLLLFESKLNSCKFTRVVDVNALARPCIALYAVVETPVPIFKIFIVGANIREL